jgi:molybdenum cofactor cytidylyltransferase
MITATIILAAGNSSRLGKPKQLILFNGTTLLQNAVKAALDASSGPVLVVEGYKNYSLPGHSRLKKVSNPEWENGMGSSLKLGLTTVENRFKPDQLLVLLSDQPFINSDLIKNLIVAREKNDTPIVASYYNNAPGVPVIFDRSIFKMVQNMSDKEGAKKILLAHPEMVSLVKFDAGKIDIDTPEDLIALQQSDWDHFTGKPK